VIRHWRDTLAGLARDPLSLAGRLDPYRKLLLYGHELQRAGRTWADLRQGLKGLTQLRRQQPENVVQALLAEDPSRLDPAARERYNQGLASESLEVLRLAVRMLALDLSYHELGGLYDRLAEAGKVDDVVLTPADVEQASREAPVGGRASVRAAQIKTLPAGGGWLCDWRYLYHPPTRTYVDLRDPFETERRTAVLEQLPPEDWPGPYHRMQGAAPTRP
jgi:hypothetical protein